MNNQKLLRDFLADYQDYRYLFEYGFGLDDYSVEQMLGKKAQTIKILANMLEPVIARCMQVPWHRIGTGNRKGRRQIVWNNHYRKGQYPWFMELYGCYGLCADPGAQRHLETCEIRRKEHSGSSCTKNCKYRTVCSIQEQMDFFRDLKGGIVSVNDFRLWAGSTCDRIRTGYAAVIESTGEGYHLKPSVWTAETMRKAGILRSEREYADFLEMVRFFCQFAPLSALGSSFLRHLGVTFGTDAFLVRGLPPEYGLEQEYIFRVLYAIAEQRLVVVEDTEYIPLRISYEDRDWTGMPEHLYLWAAEAESGKILRLPLTDGVYVRMDRKLSAEQREMRTFDIEERPDEEIELDVHFYTNGKTEYLANRWSTQWVDCMQGEPQIVGERQFVSPYYPEDTHWKINEVHYRVKRQELPGFADFIASFGDFASMSADVPKREELSLDAADKRRSAGMEEASLLHIYSSARLNDLVPELPALPQEATWLAMVLERCPHFAELFLEREAVERIRELAVQESGNRQWFDAYGMESRCKDIPERMIRRYREVLGAIRKQQILEYSVFDERVKIVPYALDFDVTRFLTGASLASPMDIMCYSLTEKRPVNVRYDGQLMTSSRCSREEAELSVYDRLYHVLAYAVRCALQEVLDLTEPVCSGALEYIWKSDRRSSQSRYVRCIRKKCRDTVDYELVYQQLKDRMEEEQDAVGLQFLQKVFSYWRGEAQDSFAVRYYGLLMQCFAAGYERLCSAEGNGFLTYLMQIDTEVIWRYIVGEPVEAIANEVAFCSEYLKLEELSFVLPSAERSAIDRVYRLFRGFLCTARFVEGKGVCFTVAYESFYYRRIHMLLMMIAEEVTEIAPVEMAQLIQQRRENRVWRST